MSWQQADSGYLAATVMSGRVAASVALSKLGPNDGKPRIGSLPSAGRTSPLRSSFPAGASTEDDVGRRESSSSSGCAPRRRVVRAVTAPRPTVAPSAERPPTSTLTPIKQPSPRRMR